MLCILFSKYDSAYMTLITLPNCALPSQTVAYIVLFGRIEIKRIEHNTQTNNKACTVKLIEFKILKLSNLLLPQN